MSIKVFFSGRLAADPEMKVVGDGMEVCRLTVAVNRYAGKGKEQATDFINCDAWGAKGAAISKYFAKGDQIIVTEGELRSSIVKAPGGSDKKDIKYWSVNINDFDFGAKKGGKSSDTTAPVDGFIKDEEIPF